MADDERDDLIPSDRQTFEIGGRYIEGDQLDAARARTLARSLTPGDIVQVTTEGGRAPVGDLRVIATEAAGGEAPALVPETGSREYVLAFRGADGRERPSAVPLRLRLRETGESVGTVEAITVEAGDPSTPADTTTGAEGERGGMSSSPSRQQVEQRYETIGTTEDAIMEDIRSLALPTTLDGYDGIGPSTADALTDNAIESPADLAVTVRREQADAPAFPPLQRALESLNAQQETAVLDAGRTLRDLAVPEPTGTPETDGSESSDDEETQPAAAESTEPTAQGFTEAEIANAMESVLKGTEAVVDIDGSEVTVGWQAAADTALQFNRESSVLTGETSRLEPLVRQVAEAYYDTVALPKETVDTIESAVDSTPLDFPDPPTSAARPDSSETEPSDSDAPSSGVFPDSAVRKARARNDALNPRGGVTFEDVAEVFKPLEAAVQERTGGLVAELRLDVDYAPSGDWVGTTVTAALDPAERDRLVGASVLTPITVSVPADDPIARMEDFVRGIQALDSESGADSAFAERMDALSAVTDDKFRTGRVDFDQMFLTAGDIRSFARYLPELYDESLQSYMQSVDLAFAVAQFATAAEQNPSTFRQALDEYQARFSVGSRPRAVVDAAVDELESGQFDQAQFARRYWRVDSGNRNVGDIVTETKRKQQEQQAGIRGETADGVADPDSATEIRLLYTPGDGTNDTTGEVVETGETVDPDNGGLFLATLEVKPDVDFARYSSGDVYGRATIAADDVIDAEPVAPSGGERTPVSGTQTQGSDPDKPGSSDTTDSGTSPTGDRASISDDPARIDSAEIDTFEAESVSIDSVSIGIEGDVSFGQESLDPETIDAIEAEIESAIDTDDSE